MLDYSQYTDTQVEALCCSAQTREDLAIATFINARASAAEKALAQRRLEKASAEWNAAHDERRRRRRAVGKD